MSAYDDRTGRRLLWIGTLAGILMAAVGIVRSGDTLPSSRDAVAIVNDQPISKDAVARFTAAVAAERRQPELGIQERRRLLQRVIDEELLLQRGISLGLARHEPTARRMIVQSVIASVTGSAESREPSDDKLREFYAESQDRFNRPGRYRVDAFKVTFQGRGDIEARDIAEAAVESLRVGVPLSELQAQMPELTRATLPRGPLPLESVRQYLGPSAALAVQDLEAGQVADPVRVSSAYLVLSMRERTQDQLPAFEAIRDQVRAEYLRSLGEKALADFLEDLRASSEIEILDPELAP